MEWSDTGIVLSGKPLGEHDILLSLLTSRHGRVNGIVKGGQSRTKRGMLQPGNRLDVTWRARLETQLGVFSPELKSGHSLALSRDPGPLMALVSCLALTSAALPEREDHHPVHTGLWGVIDLLDAAGADPADRLLWGTGIVRYELGILRDLGFGLDLSECAATGQTDDLCYVSPKSGRAVSRDAGHGWRDRLLSLPEFLLTVGQNARNLSEVDDGLKLTGFFLNRYLLEPAGRQMPAARLRLIDYFRTVENSAIRG